MKKQYMSPNMEVVKIETMSVLAASDPSSVNSSFSGTPISGGYVDGREDDGYDW